MKIYYKYIREVSGDGTVAHYFFFFSFFFFFFFYFFYLFYISPFLSPIEFMICSLDSLKLINTLMFWFFLVVYMLFVALLLIYCL